MTATMPDGVASAAACIASPRAFTTVSPSSNDIAPANTSAVYSPRLSPAVATTSLTASGSAALSCSRAARLATKMAGWLTSVALSLSAGPLVQTPSRS